MNIINPGARAQQIHSTLWTIHDVFTEDFLADLDRHFSAGTVWHMDRDFARLSYPADPNHDHEFVDAGNIFSDWVSTVLSKPVVYQTAKLFLDLPDSHVPVHSDAADIDIMSQIYLMDTHRALPGTVFMEPVICTVPYRRNSGYININTDLKKHMSPRVVDSVRTSLAFQLLFA